jgi:transglutaminase-like putative cysteine protease
MKPLQGQLQKAIYLVFGFLVLWEWLKPLSVITDTANITTFLYFVGLCFLLSYLALPIYVTFPVKALAISYAIQRLFFEGSFLGKAWLGDFYNIVTMNVSYMLLGNWWELTNSFRSLLFFILLWLLAYLMEYWIVQLKKIFLLLFVTIIYLATLDTFSPYDADLAIVRMVVFGFIILGLLKLERLRDDTAITLNNKTRMKWLIPLIFFTLMTTSIGYLAPKAAPQWPDPIPFLQGYGKGEGFGNGVKRVGYGTNDSRLGGPFIGDETVVFTAEMRNKQYWRVETKDVYTGKGWLSSASSIQAITNGQEVTIPMLESAVISEAFSAKVAVNVAYPHVVYPVELTSVSTNEEVVFQIDTETEKVMTERKGEPYSLTKYIVSYNVPKYSMEALLSAPNNESLVFLVHFTQLPEELPDRVRELALEITAPFNNRYDKAKAVERFFRASGYEYETVEVAVPGPDDDYVDQFLFDTKVGYCDNFSTSMIVLLRSVGIPARWVKGYTGGDYVTTLSDNNRIFEVNNGNAHSWVEVYFPGSGWVPFEPTKGFSNPYSFVSEQEKNETPLPVPNVPDQPELPEDDLLSEEDQGTKSTGTKTWTLNITWKDVLKLLGVLLVILSILYFNRRKWFPRYLLWRYGKFKNESSYVKAYFILVGALNRFGLKRKDSQTLREYASYVDSFFYSKDMRKMTVKLESIQYSKGKKIEEKELEKLRKLWENLIKNVAS